MVGEGLLVAPSIFIMLMRAISSESMWVWVSGGANMPISDGSAVSMNPEESKLVSFPGVTVMAGVSRATGASGLVRVPCLTGASGAVGVPGPTGFSVLDRGA